MSVGYSLGNRNESVENIELLGENGPNTIAFSSALPITISRMCQNNCPYCAFHKKDSLTIPYSTIRATKESRLHGVREAFHAAGERPDTFPHIRALLELWGFDSYLDYLYTVCELSFLEGLIPVIEVGFLSPKELKKMQEISAITKIMLDSVDKFNPKRLHPESPGKKWDIRFKQIEWASKIKFPVATGILVGAGELKGQRKEALKEIAKLHKEYGMIHEVLIQNFVPQANTPLEKKQPASKELHLNTVELALSILPSDVTVTVPYETTTDIDDFIRAGVRDLGRLFTDSPIITPTTTTPSFEELTTKITKLGFTLQQRFPLKKSFIQEGLFSKKLGQVFENYRYKLKKETQEKAKLKPA